MSRVLLLSLSAVALALALVFLTRSGDPGAREAAELPQSAVVPTGASGEPEAPVSLTVGGSSDTQRIEGGAAPTTDPAAGATGTSAAPGEAIPDGRVLSLTVVDVERRPVSGLALRLTTAAGTEVTARTDEEGRLVTAAMWSQGVVEVEHVQNAEQPLRWRLEPGLCLIDVGPGEVQEAELSATEPAAGMRIRALNADDSPLTGARVWISLAALDGEPDWERVRRATTGDDGLAVFSLYGTEASTSRAMYGLHLAQTEVVARTLFVEPPLDATFLLVAHPPGEVLVRTVDEQGEPVTGLQVVAHPKEHYMGIYGERVLVDSLGQARLRPLAPGVYTVKAQYPGQAFYPFSTSIELTPAEHAEVTLTVTPGEQPLVVAAGVVLDESGEPLERVQVSLQLGNGRPQRVSTDADGRFLLTGFRSSDGSRGPLDPQSVRVTAEASIFGDTFEPSAVDVPFGTEDLEFRRTAQNEITSSVFNLLDAYTGEPIQKDAEAMVYVYREPEAGRRIHAYMTFGPDARGVCLVEYFPNEDLRYVVEALGYQRQSGVLKQTAPGEPPALHRIELLPGYSRHLVVRSRDVGVLAGVQVKDAEGRVLGTSDARGELHLDLPEAPGTLLFEAEGFLSLAWESYNYWSNASRTVWLAPR